ncbi:hypothetical protein KY320_00470 [Candidatus Woesearchaeota archaeon]|nr:hypothetical protein [Candidatus Woesearchaeota archaeon]
MELFSKDIVAYFSINQIAKLIGKTYPYVNKRVGYLIEEGILKKNVVGASHLCSVNFSNDKAIVLLSLVEIEKRDRFWNTRQELQKAFELIVKDNEERVFHCVLMHKKQLIFVVDDSKCKVKIEGYDTKCVDKPGFKKLLLEGAILQDHTIISGFERYFEFIRGVERELKLKSIPL